MSAPKCARVRCQAWPDLGARLGLLGLILARFGGVPGGLGAHFRLLRGSLWGIVFEVVSGAVLGAILVPFSDPKRFENDPGKAPETSPDAEGRKY